jgi:glycosyltransferase involved in cell wall biosynthesis
LIRTGTDDQPLFDSDRPWWKKIERRLGRVSREEIPEVLAAADIFVQPGVPGPFNDLRLPSKLPEFFAIGRPVILPRTNIGTQLRNRVDAFVVEKADAAAIAAGLQELWHDDALYHGLSDGALKASRRWLTDPAAGNRLIQFYNALLA